MLEGSVWTGDDVGSGPVWTGDDTISGPVWTGDNTSPNPVSGFKLEFKKTHLKSKNAT